jgi:hypothetical protein
MKLGLPQHRVAKFLIFTFRPSSHSYFEYADKYCATALATIWQPFAFR